MSNKRMQDCGEYKQAQQYVPTRLPAAGEAPVNISRALLRSMAYHEAFRDKHGYRLQEALNQGLIVITSDAPSASSPTQPPAQPSGTNQQGA
jgi:hypothetical protein